MFHLDRTIAQWVNLLNVGHRFRQSCHRSIAKFAQSVAAKRSLSHCLCNQKPAPIHSPQQATVASIWRDQMNTIRSTRFAGLLMAVTMTVAVHGAVLLTFNSAAQESQASAGQSPTLVTLDTVNIVAHRS
jgi:hypothetical protein